jgi:hypothetical protein
VPGLQIPQIGTALLTNRTIDDEKWEGAILEMVTVTASKIPLELLKAKEEVKEDGFVPSLSEHEKIFLEFEGGMKDYFRRNFAEKDPSAEDKKQDVGFAWLNFGQRDKPKGLSPEEIAKKRLTFLKRSVDFLNEVFKIPFFDLKPRGLLYELSRAFFFRCEPIHTLQALCQLGKQTKSFAFHFHLQSALTQRGVKILEEVVPLYSATSSSELAKIITMINETLSKESTLSQTLTHALLSFAVSPVQNPQLNLCLRHSETLTQILNHRGSEPSKWVENTPLHTLLKSVHALFIGTANDVINNSIPLSTLHTVLSNSDAFISLLRVFKFTQLTSDNLKQRSGSLEAFDRTLGEIKTYTTLFCQCGVRINADELSGLITDLTKRYDNLALKEISSIFQKMLSMTGSSVGWLYHLRASELFLALWREQGKKLLLAKARAQHEKDDKDHGKDHKDDSHSSSSNSNTSNSGHDNKDSKEKDEKKAKEDLAKKKMEEALAMIEAKDVALEQSEVFSSLIPNVQKEWTSLMDSMKNKTISIDNLTRTFGKLDGIGQYMAELSILALTGDGKAPAM